MRISQQRKEIANLKQNEERLTKLVDQLMQMLARKRAEAPKTVPKKAQGPRSQQGSPRNERVPEPSGDDSAFGQLKGRLHLPVRGELRARFGNQREDTGVLWKGLFISTGAGQEVRAIAAGRVVFADWLRGFGNLLIIDHGAGYMSLYGNNESLLKQPGDVVRSGEAIAATGNSGGNTDSGLYFEMRYQGRAFDPLSWVTLK